MDLGVPELLIILFIVVLLFGTKKLPGAAKAIGQSLKIFRDETKGLRSDGDPSPATTGQASAPAAITPPSPAVDPTSAGATVPPVPEDPDRPSVS